MPQERANTAIGQRTRQFIAGRDGQRGAGAIEFALIIPFLLLMVVAIIEMSNIYFMRSQLNEIARDATRRVAVGALELSAAEAFVLARLANTSNVRGAVEVAETETDDIVDVTLSLSVPFADVLLFDQFLQSLWSEAPTHLTVDATMMKH